MNEINSSGVKWLGYICLTLSVLVMIGWVFEYQLILNIIPGGATMKFNTALCFFLVSIHLLGRKDEMITKLLWIPLCLIVIIAGYSLIEYLFPGIPGIDNMFVTDNLSLGKKGRMSPSTAFCFMFLGLAFFISTYKRRGKNTILKGLIIAVLFVSFISFVSNILVVPMENKGGFFKTMSLLTSSLFLTLSISELLRQPNLGFRKLVFSEYGGSRLIRTALPVLIVLPLLLDFFLLYNLNQNGPYKTDFAIVFGTILLTVFSVLTLMIAAYNLNRSEQKRKLVEEELFEAKQERMRVGLLKETHHRVKNNFQLVSSLLSLQEAKLDNKELKNILDNCKDRIRTMAAIHENMYVNQTYEHIEIQSFFRSIINTLIMAHPTGLKIEVEYQVEQLNLNMKYAIPLSIIINEAVTNSIKHAFTNVDNPKISLGLKVNEHNQVKFHISDNGIGFNLKPKGTSYEKTIGLDLIETFVKQINGTIETKEGNGACYVIQFEMEREGIAVVA